MRLDNKLFQSIYYEPKKRQFFFSLFSFFFILSSLSIELWLTDFLKFYFLSKELFNILFLLLPVCFNGDHLLRNIWILVSDIKWEERRKWSIESYRFRYISCFVVVFLSIKLLKTIVYSTIRNFFSFVCATYSFWKSVTLSEPREKKNRKNKKKNIFKSDFNNERNVALHLETEFTIARDSHPKRPPTQKIK